MDAHHIGPEWDALRHAQLLAAAHNGALVRTDKRQWAAADFMPRDPWAPAAPRPGPPVAESAQQLLANMVSAGMLEPDA